MIRKILGSRRTLAKSIEKEQRLRRNITRHEAVVGGTLFVPVPKGTRREFFCLDEYTWIWYEESIENGKRKSQTTRYNVMAKGIIKSVDGRAYKKVEQEEAQRLLEAAKAYQKKVEKEVYQPILRAL